MSFSMLTRYLKKWITLTVFDACIFPENTLPHSTIILSIPFSPPAFPFLSEVNMYNENMPDMEGDT